VRIRDHHRTFQKAGLFHPGRAGHLSVAVLRKPPAKTGVIMESLPRGNTAVTPVRTGPLPTCQLPFSADQSRMTYLYAGNIGDGIQLPWRPSNGNA
jgi:hypothetical protein